MSVGRRRWAEGGHQTAAASCAPARWCPCTTCMAYYRRPCEGTIYLIWCCITQNLGADGSWDGQRPHSLSAAFPSRDQEDAAGQALLIIVVCMDMASMAGQHCVPTTVCSPARAQCSTPALACCHQQQLCTFHSAQPQPRPAHQVSQGWTGCRQISLDTPTAAHLLGTP